MSKWRRFLACSVLVLAGLSVACSSTNDTAASPLSECPDSIPWSEAANHSGQLVNVAGTVHDTSYQESSEGQPTFLKIGASYWDLHEPRFDAVIWGEDRANFPTLPEEMYAEKDVCVRGTVRMYEEELLGQTHQIPQIDVTGPDQIAILPGTSWWRVLVALALLFAAYVVVAYIGIGINRRYRKRHPKPEKPNPGSEEYRQQLEARMAKAQARQEKRGPIGRFFRRVPRFVGRAIQVAFMLWIGAWLAYSAWSYLFGPDAKARHEREEQQNRLCYYDPSFCPEPGDNPNPWPF